jgi:adenosylcobinamide hydrolase
MNEPNLMDSGWAVPKLVAIPAVEGAVGPVLVWRFPQPLRSISSAIVGGGIGISNWVLNMTVDPLYSRIDPAAHIAEVARSLELEGEGVGLLTAVNVGMHTDNATEGAMVISTVGVRRPVWAFDAREPLPESYSESAAMDHVSEHKPGTINLVCFVGQRLSDAALVNAVATVTEAKTQALYAREIPGTGTASDAVCVLCPTGGPKDIFGGPRSYWGARLAAASYAAVVDGIDRQRAVDGMRA